MAKSNELTYEQSKLIEKCYEQHMIGRVQEGEYHITDRNTIMIFVDPLCSDPIPCIDYGFDAVGARYVSFDNKSLNGYLPDGYNMILDNDDKIYELNEFYRDKLVLFKPKYRNDNGRLLKNCYIEDVFQDKGDSNFFETVPIFEMENEQFEKTLKSGEYFDIPGYHGKINYDPQILICGEFAYRLKDALGNESMLEYSDTNPERWRCFNYENIVKVRISNDEYDRYILDVLDPSIYYCFINDHYRNELLLSENYIGIEDEEEFEEILDDIEEETTVMYLASSEEEDEYSDRESSFISALYNKTFNDGLQYDYKDLVNFHTSIKTNPLTILAGISGTGKTQLAYNYANVLNLSEDNNTLLFMPISPAYNEPNDVLGYYNALNHIYVPSDTGLVNFLVEASAKPDQLYMVIFDEMNLSQVEYWFSPFISILEKNPEDRYLRLYDEHVECLNGALYPNKVKIGENIIFVGTVNIDDTTKDFSDRLLDRAFVIELHKLSFIEYFNAHMHNEKKVNEGKLNYYNLTEFKSWSHNDNKNYIYDYEYHYEELAFLDALDQLISHYLVDGGISYRVLKNISNYMNNIPRNESGDMLIARKEAFDMVVNQSVMTKIRGTENKLTRLIGRIYNDELIDSKLIELLDANKEVSEFKEIRKSIYVKAKELMNDGYTN